MLTGLKARKGYTMPNNLMTYVILVRGEASVRLGVYWEICEMFRDAQTNEFIELARVESWD